jgi:hypothetical protein
MSNYAWANPINARREQDDDLFRAIVRIQDELRDQHAADLHAVILYQQQPRFRVERTKAYSMAPKQRTRLLDWFRMKLRHREKAATEISDE